MAHAHACTGLLAGAATLPLAPVTGAAGAVAWVAAWGGAALLPDFDQGAVSWRRGFPRPTGSTAATMWGPLSLVPARLVGRLAGGHRWGTHDPVVGPAAFALTALAATLHPWAALAVLAVTVGAALRACHAVVPGSLETTVVGNLVASWAGAWWLTQRGDVDLRWLPWALAGGALVHIAGDWLTRGGVPRPLAVLLPGRRRRTSLGLFATGHRVEHAVAAVSGALAAGLLAVHVAQDLVGDLPGGLLGGLLGGG